MICYQFGDERAFITENTLKLNRPDLVIRRSERISSVEHLLFSWSHTEDGTVKNILADQLRQECLPDKEYSCTIKNFLIARGFPVDAAS